MKYINELLNQLQEDFYNVTRYDLGLSHDQSIELTDKLVKAACRRLKLDEPRLDPRYD